MPKFRPLDGLVDFAGHIEPFSNSALVSVGESQGGGLGSKFTLENAEATAYENQMVWTLVLPHICTLSRERLNIALWLCSGLDHLSDSCLQAFRTISPFSLVMLTIPIFVAHSVLTCPKSPECVALFLRERTGVLAKSPLSRAVQET